MGVRILNEILFYSLAAWYNGKRENLAGGNES